MTVSESHYNKTLTNLKKERNYTEFRNVYTDVMFIMVIIMKIPNRGSNVYCISRYAR